MSNVQVCLDLLEELARRLDPSGSDIAGRILEALVIQLVQQDAISSGKGAELLGMPKQDFRRLLRERGVPYFDLSADELRSQIEASKKAEVRRDP